jgi:hypothetical protein
MFASMGEKSTATFKGYIQLDERQSYLAVVGA